MEKRNKQNMRHFKDSLHRFILAIPFIFPMLIHSIGGMIDTSFGNSLGVTAIVSIALIYTVWDNVVAITESISSVYYVLLGAEKDNPDVVARLNTTATVLQAILSVFCSICLWVSRQIVVDFFATDPRVAEVFHNLLCMFCVLLPIESFDHVVRAHYGVYRKNTKLTIVYIVYYVFLVLGDWIAVTLHLGAEGIFAVVILSYIPYMLLLMYKSNFILGKFSFVMTKDFFKLGCAAIGTNIGNIVVQILETKLWTTLGSRGFAIYSVVKTIYGAYSDISIALGEGWQVYICEKIHTNLNMLKKETWEFVLWTVSALVLLALLTAYPLWWVCGRKLLWAECIYPLVAGCSCIIPYTLYNTFARFICALKKQKQETYSVVLGGFCVRLPILYITLHYLTLGIFAGFMAGFVDYLVRWLYLYGKLKTNDHTYHILLKSAHISTN